MQLCCTLLHLNFCPTVIFGANYSPGTWQLCLLRSYNLQNLQTATTTTMGRTTTVTTLVESLTSVNFAISIFIFLSLVLFIWQISATAKRPSELYNNKSAAHPPRAKRSLTRQQRGRGEEGKAFEGMRLVAAALAVASSSSQIILNDRKCVIIVQRAITTTISGSNNNYKNSYK